MAQENFSSQLADLLVTRNFDIELKDASGNDTSAEDAKTMSFDYVASSGNNYGRMVLILQDGNDLLGMFGDNLGRSMEDPDDKEEFLNFQQQLHDFAVRNRWHYTPTDISQLKHVMRGMAAMKEGLFESYYGNRRISYMGDPTQARLVINHVRPLGEQDARYRHIEKMFIETVEGERYKLQFNNISYAKAMLEHVRQGGRPYDVRGNHITEMVSEIAVLSRFNRASANRVLEGVTAELVTEAQSYYSQLRETVRRLSLPSGYRSYFENWEPTEITLQEELVDSIKTMFIEQTIDARIEAALPLLARLRQNTMKEAEIFESWANRLMEGTWALPDTPEKWQKLQELMSEPLMVGAGAMNATEQLDDIVGDDILFDRLQELAKEDPNANCWDDTEVQARLQQLGVSLNVDQNQAQPQDDAKPGQIAEQSRIHRRGDLVPWEGGGGMGGLGGATSTAIRNVSPRGPQGPAEKFMGQAQVVPPARLTGPGTLQSAGTKYGPDSSLLQKLGTALAGIAAGAGIPIGMLANLPGGETKPAAGKGKAYEPWEKDFVDRDRSAPKDKQGGDSLKDLDARAAASEKELKDRRARLEKDQQTADALQAQRGKKTDRSQDRSASEPKKDANVKPAATEPKKDANVKPAATEPKKGADAKVDTSVQQGSAQGFDNLRKLIDIAAGMPRPATADGASGGAIKQTDKDRINAEIDALKGVTDSKPIEFEPQYQDVPDKKDEIIPRQSVDTDRQQQIDTDIDDDDDDISNLLKDIGYTGRGPERSVELDDIDVVPFTGSVGEVPSTGELKQESKNDPMNYNAAITGSYYESLDHSDVLLARIKSLALLK